MPEASVAVGEPKVTGTVALPEAVYAVAMYKPVVAEYVPGQVMTGGASSTTVMVNEQELERPALSLAVHVTVVDPMS